MSDHDPTEAEISAVLAERFTPKGLAGLWDTQFRTLADATPRSLMETPEGRRRLLNWARALAGGRFL